MDWTTYITSEEYANFRECIRHRQLNGLSTLRVDEIDCDTQCGVKETCPFYIDDGEPLLTVELP